MRRNTVIEALKLPIRFSSVPSGVAYQLFAIGTFAYHHLNPDAPQVSLSFRKVNIADGMPLPDEPIIYKQVHVHATMSLRGGTLWTAEGAPLGPSPLLKRRSLSLGPGPIEPQKLVDILPGIDENPTSLTKLCRFLSPDLLQQLSTTPFVQIKRGKTIFLIPCFELARAFYFWTGPKMVDFFFSPVQVKHICHPQREPNAGNRQRAKIMLVIPRALQDIGNLPRAYSPLQAAQLAHLYFSPAFAYSFNRLHNSIIGRWEKGLAAHVWLNLELGKKVRVHAEGFAFTHNKQSFFWTCALPERSSYFCFSHLDYAALYDTRKATTSAAGATSNATSEPSIPASSLARMEIGPEVYHDSNKAGSSRYAGAQVHISTDEIVHHPSILRKSKELIKDHIKEWLKWWVKGRPTVLSERAGGSDLTVAKVDLHVDVHRFTYAAYFEELVKELRKLHNVNCLTQNTNIPSTSVSYCSLPRGSQPATPRPYQVGVAEIVVGTGYWKNYFYFFQVLASRSLRSGFVYKSDLKQLTAYQLDELLLAVHQKKDDWHKVKKDSNLRDDLTRKFHVELVILSRNHIYIKSDAKRCEKEIRSKEGMKEKR